MSSSPDDTDVGPLVADLVRTLHETEREFEPRTERGLPRPPSPRELIRFTSDVGIPGVILLLRTNIEALKLLQRALRLADGRAPTTGQEHGGPPARRTAEPNDALATRRCAGRPAGRRRGAARGRGCPGTARRGSRPAKPGRSEATRARQRRPSRRFDRLRSHGRTRPRRLGARRRRRGTPVDQGRVRKRTRRKRRSRRRRRHRRRGWRTGPATERTPTTASDELPVRKRTGSDAPPITK